MAPRLPRAPELWHDFPGEQFERRHEVISSEIAEKTCNEHKVAKAEFVLQLRDARCDGVRAADNCDLAEPTLGFQLLLGRDVPLHLFAGRLDLPNVIFVKDRPLLMAL